MNTKTKIKAPECLCGCGGRTKGGRFLPGHDAKLKKALIADARAGKKRAANKLEKLGTCLSPLDGSIVRLNE